jgi:hypothetical protein
VKATMWPWSCRRDRCQPPSCEARANILDRPRRREATGRDSACTVPKVTWRSRRLAIYVSG